MSTASIIRFSTLPVALTQIPDWRWIFQFKPTLDETVDVAFVDNRAYRRMTNSRTGEVLGYTTAARVDAPANAWTACDEHGHAGPVAAAR